MKRTFIIRNIVIAIIVVAIIAGAIFYFTKNKTISEYKVEKIENFNYFVVKNGALSGVIDKQGNIIVQPQYDDVQIPNPEKAIFACYKDSDVKIINENNEELYKKYEKVEPIRLQNITSDSMYEKTVLRYLEDGKYGLIDLEGKKIVKAKYDDIKSLPYKEGELIVKEEEKYGVININGDSIVPSKYDTIQVDSYYTLEDGYKYAGYIVSNTTDQGYRYGYINYKGKAVLQPDYNEVSRIIDVEDKDDLYLMFARNGQYGLVKDTNPILENQYQSILYDETNKLLTVEKSKKYGVATLQGQIIIPEEYDQIDINGENIYAQKNNETVVFDTKGNKSQIDANIVLQKTGSEKYKIELKNDNGTKYSIIGQNGEELIEQQYSYIEYLHDKYFRVSNESSKLGVIDDKGNEIIKIEYDSLQPIEGSDIIEAINIENKTITLYSGDMKKLCELSNAKIDIQSEYIKVYNNQEIKYYSKKGQELQPKEVYPQNELFAKNQNGKWGFVNSNGTFEINAIYDEVTEYNKYGFAGVKLNDKWGVLDKDGKVIIEPTYQFKDEYQPVFINKYYQVEYGYGETYYTSDVLENS